MKKMKKSSTRELLEDIKVKRRARVIAIIAIVVLFGILVFIWMYPEISSIIGGILGLLGLLLMECMCISDL